MSCKITFMEDTKIIKSVYYGTIVPNEVADTMVENLKLAKKHQTNLFLVDCTEIENESSFIIENYESGILLVKMAKELPGRLKDAVILPSSPKAAENLRFFETVSRNRGMNVRTFEKEEAALAWLLEE